MKTELLTINRYSRCGKKLEKVKGIVVHWVANPNTTSKQNRDFFESRKSGVMGFGSAHYIINLDGEILQCIPVDEIAYHVGSSHYINDAIEKLGKNPNNCTIGIECTHVDWKGKMTAETYSSLIQLCIDLCKRFNLDSDDIYLHYDITGKTCHKWFVNNRVEWEEFKISIDNQLGSKNEKYTSI